MYCNLEFNLRYLKNLKLFSISVKEFFEPMVLQKKGDGFLLFLKAFSWETDLYSKITKRYSKIGFLRNRSLSNAWWFYCKQYLLFYFICKDYCNIGKGNLYISENRLSTYEMWCATDNYNHMYHICVKGFLDSNFNEVYSYISNSPEIAPNSIYSQKS